MLQNIPKEKILEVVKQGPTIPSKIVKVVGGDTMLIGAILSGMISTGEIRYSSLKVGGSPIYYIPEHEARLEEFMQYLNDKDQKNARILKEEKVIPESKLDPLARVSMKTIKDFAKQFELGNKLFYRYFLVDKEEAERLASEIIKQEENSAKDVILNKDSSQTEKTITVNQVASPEPSPEKNTLDSEKTVSQQSKPEVMVEAPNDHKRETMHETRHVKHHNFMQTNERKKDFFEKIKEYIHKKGLDIISKEKIKKTEYSLVLKNHDSNEYIYCVAKDKKTINEGDLSTAFVFSHHKRMPCIFLMTGHLTKKAEIMKEKEFKEMTIEIL